LKDEGGSENGRTGKKSGGGEFKRQYLTLKKEESTKLLSSTLNTCFSRSNSSFSDKSLF
jgi:hypothetical protein